MERLLFGQRNGLYSFPTPELVDHMRAVIGDRSAIEIGAGHGALCQALGIPGTDTREQERPEYKMLLALQSNQPPVRYGDHVIALEASDAVRQYQPDVVIACWVTQRWDPTKLDEIDSKHDGVDEDFVIDNCQSYILVGNEKVHRNKRIWRRRHRLLQPSYVYSRAANGSPDFIAVFRGGKRPR